MASMIIENVRIPWEYFEKRIYRDCGITDEQFSEIKNGLRAKYDNGDFDISLGIDLIEKDK